MSTQRELPIFKYFPDPVGNKSIVKSKAICDCCNIKTGFIYEGPFFSRQNEPVLCPWCISSGMAAEKYNCVFTDCEFSKEEVTSEIYDELNKRTPGFTSWQDPNWLGHCHDGCAYLGMFGQNELASVSEEIKNAVWEACSEHVSNKVDQQEFYDSLDIDGATAYVFKCLHCCLYLSYIDYT